MRTIGSNEASQEAKALVLALRDVLSNEEAWAIAEEHLKRARVFAWKVTASDIEGWADVALAKLKAER